MGQSTLELSSLFNPWTILNNCGFLFWNPKASKASIVSFGEISPIWLTSNKSKACFNSLKSPFGKGTAFFNLASFWPKIRTT